MRMRRFCSATTDGTRLIAVLARRLLHLGVAEVERVRHARQRCGGDEAKADSCRGLVMRLTNLPGVLGITPVSMERSDDPLDVLTKFGTAAVAV
jgi:hypothetical protein